MALIKDSEGRETAPPPSRGKRLLPQQGRGPLVNPRAPRPAPENQFRRQPAQERLPASMYRPEPKKPSRKPTVDEALRMYGIPGREPNRMQEGYNPGRVQQEAAAQARRNAYNATGAQTTASAFGPNMANPATAINPEGDPEIRRQIEARVQSGSRAQPSGNMAEEYALRARMGERDRLRRERESNDRKENIRALSTEQWNALSPMQQAAVQANADLAAAVKQDFLAARTRRPENEAGASREQLDAYRARVEELFGPDGAVGYRGLEYAPNTLAFLDERGYTREDLRGRTLDDFISGDALLDSDTVRALESGGEQPRGALGEPVDGTGRDANLAFARSLASGQLAYQEKLAATLAKGDALLSGMAQGSTNRAASDTYGASVQPAQSKLTAVRPETLQQIEKYMEALARPDLDLTESMSMIELDLQQRGAGQDEVDQVYQNLRDRARLGMQSEGSWFPDVEYTLRSPAEVAQTLGVPTLKRKEG